MTNIRKASKQDIPALCAIWKACFSDTEEYIRYFYDENFERMEVLVCCLDGKPVCMVHFFDTTFVYKGECQSAKYMYAGGTLPAYRRRGCLRALLKYAQIRADETGDALFFKPVSPSLTDYFSGLGYQIDAYFRVVNIWPAQKQPLTVYDLGYLEYNRMRNEAFSAMPYAKWQDEYVRWCVDENAYCSGKTLGIKHDGKDYFLMGYTEDEQLIINETSLSITQLRQLSGALCDLFGADNIKAYLPEAACDEGEAVISSFIYNTPPRHTYVNLILI